MTSVLFSHLNFKDDDSPLRHIHNHHTIHLSLVKFGVGGNDKSNNMYVPLILFDTSETYDV